MTASSGRIARRRGRASRQKGARVERAFAKLTGGQRVPLSRALRGSLTNDVALPDGLRVEVKARVIAWRRRRVRTAWRQRQGRQAQAEASAWAMSQDHPLVQAFGGLENLLVADVPAEEAARLRGEEDMP
jgi:hypothetical protein